MNIGDYFPQLHSVEGYDIDLKNGEFFDKIVIYASACRTNYEDLDFLMDLLADNKVQNLIPFVEIVAMADCRKLSKNLSSVVEPFIKWIIQKKRYRIQQYFPFWSYPPRFHFIPFWKEDISQFKNFGIADSRKNFHIWITIKNQIIAHFDSKTKNLTKEIQKTFENIEILPKK